MSQALFALTPASWLAWKGPRLDWGSTPPILVLRFSFEDRGQQYIIETRSADPRKLLDDQREQLVFMPERPDRAELVDGMPGQPRIRPDGTIAVRGHIAGGVVALLFLAAVIGANVVGIYNWLR